MASFAQQMNNLWVQLYPPGGNVSANAGTDPHVTGFGGQRYQCQPKNDTLYFRNLSAEFEMHGRHEGPNSKLESPIQISAIAIRVRSQRIEYNMQGRNFMDPNNNGFLIDGGAIQLTYKGLFLKESQTSIILENANMFHVYTAAGIKLTVYNCSGSNLTVTLTLPRSIAQNAEPSLFGNLTGGHGQMISASGIFSNSAAHAQKEFADPGQFEELSCKGRHCSKCGLCRDWYFTGDAETWRWIQGWKSWDNTQWSRYLDWGNGAWKLWKKRNDGATCRGVVVVRDGRDGDGRRRRVFRDRRRGCGGGGRRGVGGGGGRCVCPDNYRP